MKITHDDFLLPIGKLEQNSINIYILFLAVYLVKLVICWI